MNKKNRDFNHWYELVHSQRALEIIGDCLRMDQEYKEALKQEDSK